MSDKGVPAIRGTAGRYPLSERGKVATTGHVLDKDIGDGTMISKAMIGHEGCPWCIPPEYRGFFPSWALRCRDHGKLELPTDDPYPMSERELELAEWREWNLVASKIGVPVRHRRAHLEKSEQTPAMLAAREYYQNDENTRRGLVLSGPTGVGKTFALVALLRQEAQPDGKGYVFFTMPELVRQLIGQASEDVLDQCLGAEVLAVDDVGAAYVKSDGLAEALFEQIVCEREASEAVTWLSTNLTVQRFGEVLGDRIADRVRGDGFLWYSLPGASLRHRRPRTEQPA